MARYGCLVIGTILALIILFVIVYFWSGWLNRPVGHSIATTESPARPVPVERTPVIADGVFRRSW